MIASIIYIFLWASIASASMFDFLQHQFGGHEQQRGQVDHENQLLNTKCDKYLCQDTQVCANSPKECPCLYPSSQLRCVLPNENYVCISKPHIFDGGKYDDPKTNWKVDAKDDNIRDCGWVLRAWHGLV